MTFSVASHQDKEIYSRLVPSIDLTAGADDIKAAWDYHKAQSRLALACVNDEIEPDQLLDGLFDVMGNAIDPYLDEVLLGLERLTIHHA